jgi:hypothetical protein
LHARCADTGPVNFPGFRSNVDIVAQCEGIAPLLAAEQILCWFGLDNAVRSLARPGEDSAGPAWKSPLPLHDRQGGAPFPVHALGTSGGCARPPDYAGLPRSVTANGSDGSGRHRYTNPRSVW